MTARVTFILTGEERDTLERWARRPTSAQALALRCRIVLAAADGERSNDIAERLGCSASTVGKWRGRFARHRLDGLHDEPRPGAPRTDHRRRCGAGDRQDPGGARRRMRPTGRPGRWPQATGMSQSAVSRIWRAFGLKPHLVENFKLSPDPLFIDKVRDIVGLYLNPPDAAVVLCVDEKSQIQALDRTAPVLPLLPGTPERRTHDYVRNGTTNLYAALDVASGHVIADLTARHRAEEFRRFLNLIDRTVPAAPRRPRRRWTTPPPTRPHRSSAGSAPPPLHAALHPDLQLVAEPRRALVRRADHQMDHAAAPTDRSRDLVASIRTWITDWNDNPRPFVWHKTADRDPRHPRRTTASESPTQVTRYRGRSVVGTGA